MRVLSVPASRAAAVAAAVAGLATLAGCSGSHNAAQSGGDHAVLAREEHVYNGQLHPGVAGGGGNEVYPGGDNPSNPDPVGHTGGNEPAPVLVNHVGLHDRSASGQVGAEHSGSVTAACRVGEQAVGGGYAFTADAYGNALAARVPADLYPVLENYPSAATSWTATVVNRSDATVLLTVHVVCADQGVGVRVTTGSGTVSTSAPASAACPGDAPVLTSGGWRIATTSRASQVVGVVSSSPGYGSGVSSWQVRTRIPMGSTASNASRVTAYAMCAASPLGQGSGASTSVDVPGGGSDSATSAEGRVACGRGEQPTGGGFVLDADSVASVINTFPAYGDSAYWGTTVVSLPGQGYEGLVNSGAHATLMAVCVTG